MARHRYFNTNNLWVRLDKLKVLGSWTMIHISPSGASHRERSSTILTCTSALSLVQESIVAAGGLIPLPMIKNGKTVDPKVRKQPSRRQTHTARSVGQATPFIPSSARRWPRTGQRISHELEEAGRLIHPHPIVPLTGRQQPRGLPAGDGYGCGHRVLPRRLGRGCAPHALRARQEVQRPAAPPLRRLRAYARQVRPLAPQTQHEYPFLSLTTPCQTSTDYTHRLPPVLALLLLSLLLLTATTCPPLVLLLPRSRPALNPIRKGQVPILTLDDKAYKLVQQLEAATTGGNPSLAQADRVTINGEASSKLDGVSSRGVASSSSLRVTTVCSWQARCG